MAKRISITSRFIADSKKLVSTFGAVRKDSFQKYLETTFDISANGAEQIIESLLRLRDFVLAKYSGTTIIKTSKEKTANYDCLDAFEAYLSIYEEEKAADPDSEVTVMKTGLPSDFVLGTTSGYVYDMIINNDRGPQKVKLLEKSDKKRYRNQVTLFVFTSGTDLSKEKAPALPGKYRLAVVRRSDNGKARCALGKIEGKNE